LELKRTVKGLTEKRNGHALRIAMFGIGAANVAELKKTDRLHPM
jgi:hypothetical protein